MRRHRPDLLAYVRDLIARIELVEPAERVWEVAASLEPSTMRTLESLHLATAVELGTSIEAVVTYDTRMVVAARGAGFHVLHPGVEHAGAPFA